MKITRISVYQVDLPLEHPYWLSGGRLKFEMLDATLIKIETDAGIVGWGEGTPWGHTYVPAHGPGIRAGIETMAPFIMGLDPRKVLDVERAMDLALPGHLYAKSPIDMACWPADCRSDGRRITHAACHSLVGWCEDSGGNPRRDRPIPPAWVRSSLRQDRRRCGA
jgi:L-alanine-DL-glutamate epimerase-like enolase superfamily enzyme